MSWCRISGASRKLPPDWQEKVNSIVRRVAKAQTDTKNDDGALVPAVPDDRFCNTDHIPMYKEDVGKYSWSEKNSGGRQIRTGGAEKERFTVQPTITKSGKKLKLFIIFIKDGFRKCKNWAGVKQQN